MTLNISTPFAYYVGHGTLDFDFTDIRKEERITWSANQKQADDFNQEAQTLGLENFHGDESFDMDVKYFQPIFGTRGR